MQKSKNMNNLNIEKITASDLKEIHDIEKRCYANPWKYHSMENELKLPFAFHYKFIINSKIAGYSFCSIFLDNLQINNFCIDQKYQNKGNGYAFLKSLIEEARNKGVKIITLEVDTKNLKALNLYEKFGFQKDRTIKNFYSNGNNALRMFLTIDS